MKNFNLKITVLYILLFLISSCNVVKRVPQEKYLLRKNTLLENEKNPKELDASGYLQQKPNSRLLGLPLSLTLFNWANPNSEQEYHSWLEKHPKTHHFLNKLLSKKQVQRLGKSFLISGKDKMLMNLGEPPIIMDSVKTMKTANILKAYYRSNGYFNAEASYQIAPIKNKKQQMEVTYNITSGKPYFIDSLLSRISSPQLDSVYVEHISKQIIKKKQQYSLNKFAQERERLNTLFRNQGFYNFQQSAINFEIERDTITQNEDYHISVRTQIDDFLDRSGETPKKKPYEIHKIGKINLYTDYDFSGGNTKYDTIQYKDLTIHYRGNLRFRRSTLYNATALRQGDIYKDDNRSATYRQISNLRMFRYPNIQYSYSPLDSLKRTLDADIYLTPLPRYSTEFNVELTHSDIQALGIGGNIAFQAKNLFRGAEILQLSTRGTIGSQKLVTDTRFFNVLEYGGDISLNMPRIWFFLNTDKIIPYSMTPQTLLQLGTTFQKNIGLDRNKIQGVLRYSWNPTIKNKAILELLDIEYIKNLNPSNFFSVYQSSYNYLNQIAQNNNIGSSYMNANNNLEDSQVLNFITDALNNKFSSIPANEYPKIVNVYERYHRLTHNDLIMATSFSYIFNNSNQYYLPDFHQFRIKLETAGNIAHLLAKLQNKSNDSNGQKQFFGVNYSQYIKTEIEYIKHWNLRNDNVLAFRLFTGIAIPFGNGKSIPFSRSYFAGGSNDNRAWRAYSLGPGHSNSFLDYNEANFKFATNLEYRFPIKGPFKGALFADAGNIWNVFDKIKDSDWKLDKLSDVEDIALGTGLGIRYDFNYFVLRLDLGMKTYDPSKPMSNRWINKFDINDFVFNIGINYPF